MLFVLQVCRPFCGRAPAVFISILTQPPNTEPHRGRGAGCPRPPLCRVVGTSLVCSLAFNFFFFKERWFPGSMVSPQKHALLVCPTASRASPGPSAPTWRTRFTGITALQWSFDLGLHFSYPCQLSWGKWESLSCPLHEGRLLVRYFSQCMSSLKLGLQISNRIKTLSHGLLSKLANMELSVPKLYSFLGWIFSPPKICSRQNLWMWPHLEIPLQM